MAPVTNTRVLFNEHPVGYPIPGQTTVFDTSQKIDLDGIKLGGGILVKTLVLSIDPFIRGLMMAPTAGGANPLAYSIGRPISNYGVGLVLRSENPAFQRGARVYGILPFEEYSVLKDASRLRQMENAGIPWEVYIGTLGMPGQTAYFGWKEFSAAKKGDTVLVTTAGGPVGSLVVQLAKQDGLKVIATAGSEGKCEFVRSLGADVVFNYKKESMKDILEREGPIDIYWDNVGGETLDLALQYANTNGRFIQCGAISMYNDPSFPGIRNYTQIFRKQLTIHGLIVSALAPKYTEEFYRVMVPQVKEMRIQHREDISKGLETVEQGILDVLQGNNTAKKVIRVAEE